MIYTFANQKGGVGKTSCTVNFCYELATRGFKVLMVDLDPSRNATISIGFREAENTYRTLYDLYSEERNHENITIHDVIYSTNYSNFDLIPSNTQVAWVERIASTSSGGDTILKVSLDEIRNEYDFIVIDTPPTLSKILDSAFIASDAVLIPVQCQYLAMIGMAQLLGTFQQIRKLRNHQLRIGGAFANMYDAREKFSAETLEQIKHFYESRALNNVIRKRAVINKSQEKGIPVHLMEDAKEAAQDFKDLVDEVMMLNDSTANQKPAASA